MNGGGKAGGAGGARGEFANAEQRASAWREASCAERVPTGDDGRESHEQAQASRRRAQVVTASTSCC